MMKVIILIIIIYNNNINLVKFPKGVDTSSLLVSYLKTIKSEPPKRYKFI
jgi:hypothetical protein